MSESDAAVEIPEAPAAEAKQEGARSSPQRAPMRVDESKLMAMYANFCRVTGTPEELIVDFGLNAQPVGMGDEPVAVSQRIVLNFFTAKRLMHALQMSVQRHEAAFGVLETDVQKRVKAPGRPSAK